MHEKTILLHSLLKKTTSPRTIPPHVIHASTVVFKNFKEFIDPPQKKVTYGRYGLEPHKSLRSALSALEGAYDTILTSSGMQAIAMVLLAILKADDHILIADGVYQPTRSFADYCLQNYAIHVTYFDPLDMEALEAKVRSTTKAIFFETPHSYTMEMPHIDGILSIAQRHKIYSIVDNTWGAGYLFKPLAIGVDITIQAATKYISGHADLLLGTISIRDKDVFLTIDKRIKYLGCSVTPDDVYLTLRGLRTLAVRMEQHAKNAWDIIDFLRSHPLISQVICPGLQGTPGHNHWQKHFTGICGLLSFTFKKKYNNDALGVFVDALKLFPLGYSWGGFESLICVSNPIRTVNAWKKGSVIRLHIGLEDTKDLIEDLAQALDKLSNRDADSL